MWRVLFLLVGMLAFADSTAEMRARIRAEIEFDHWWERYLLSEHGCPVEEGRTPVVVPLLPSDCRPERAEPDAGAFLKARALAKKVFDLHE